VARSLGRQLRAWREAHRLSQLEVAQRLDWQQPAVARLEGGAVAPTSTTLALLAERLGVRITFGASGASSESGGVVLTDAAPGAAGSSVSSEASSSWTSSR
jgi:transcriptional regulator with XRE-family HTH domain